MMKDLYVLVSKKTLEGSVLLFSETDEATIAKELDRRYSQTVGFDYI